MRSLVLATDIDVLAPDRELVRRADHWVIRSPTNPAHFWGNFLIYDAPPAPGDGERWMAEFAAEFPAAGHRTFAWDRIDGELGAAAEEFPGFELERMVGLLAEPEDLVDHPRANAEVVVRALDVEDDPAWEQVVGVWMAQNAADPEPYPVELHRAFAEARLRDLRGVFRRGRGAWFGAYDGDELVGSLGVVITDGRARYQMVDTVAAHRGRGIASRLVVEAGRRVAARAEVDSLVIAADADYHALGIYESLGFRRAERVTGVMRRPPERG